MCFLDCVEVDVLILREVVDHRPLIHHQLLLLLEHHPAVVLLVLVAIDQGTTSSRFIVFDEAGSIIKQHQQEFTQYLPDEVSVEHDPNEIWESVLNCIMEVDKEFSIDQLDSIGITNQRETTLAWRKSTAEPLHNALHWQDTRTQNI